MNATCAIHNRVIARAAKHNSEYRFMLCAIQGNKDLQGCQTRF
jgi:hypothetical protein